MCGGAVWLRDIFTVGYRPAGDGETRRVTSQDGYVAALQAFIFLVAFGFALCFSHWITLERQTGYVSKLAVEVVLIAVMVGAVAVMVTLLWCKRAAHLHWKDRVKGMQRLGFQGKLRRALPVIGIVMFFILGSFLDVSLVIGRASCMDEYRLCGSFVHATFAVSLLFHIIRFIFMGTEMIFCCTFHDRVMKQCAKVRYAIMLVAAATILVWFDNTLYDSSSVFEVNESVALNASCEFWKGNPETSNATDSIYKCIWHQTDLYEEIDKFAPVIYPLNIEFLLLATEMLLHLFVSVKPKRSSAKPKSDKKQRQINNRHRPVESPGMEDSIPQRLWQSDTALNTAHIQFHHRTSLVLELLRIDQASTDQSARLQDQTLPKLVVSDQISSQSTPANSSRSAPILDHSQESTSDQSVRKRRKHIRSSRNKRTRQNSDENILLSTSSASSEERDGNLERRAPPSTSRCLRPLSIFFALFMNILLITFGFLTFLQYKFDLWLGIYEWAKIATSIIFIVVCLVGFWASRNFRAQTEEHMYSGLDMMVLCSVFGLMLYGFFTAISAVAFLLGTEVESRLVTQGAHHHEALNPGLLLTDSTLNLVQVFVQSLFMAHAINVQPPGGRGRQRTRGRRLRAAEQSAADRTARAIYRSAILFLGVSNVSIWVIDSFIEVKNESVAPIQEYYFSPPTWRVISHVTMPLAFFYRFNSAIIFAKIFLDK